MAMRSKRRRRALLLIASTGVIAFASMGCNPSKRGAVSGKVTLDGEPVSAGVISFVALNGEHAASAWGRITEGQYAIAASEGPAVGECRVEIRWPRATGRVLPAVAPANSGEMIEEKTEAVPAEYNSASTLRQKIEPGDNVADFTLTSRRDDGATLTP